MLCYLIDWGIAIQSDQVTGGSLVGTPLYMSPEQAQTLPIDTRSDLYSVALVGYELLALVASRQMNTSLMEFIQEIPTMTIKHLEFIESPVQDNIPIELTLAINQMLDPDITKRFQSAEEFMQAMENHRSGYLCIVCPRTLIKSPL